MREVATFCALLALLLPTAALAQDPTANDPEQDSPAGSVYELPLDSAREDGAPRKDAGSPSGGEEAGESAAGGNTDSPIRSENNFGSSARVPGADSPQAATKPGATSEVATPIAAAEEGGESGPSLSLILLLVVLLVVVGAGTGTLATRSRRS